MDEWPKKERTCTYCFDSQLKESDYFDDYYSDDELYENIRIESEEQNNEEINKEYIEHDRKTIEILLEESELLGKKELFFCRKFLEDNRILTEEEYERIDKIYEREGENFFKGFLQTFVSENLAEKKRKYGYYLFNLLYIGYPDTRNLWHLMRLDNWDIYRGIAILCNISPSSIVFDNKGYIYKDEKARQNGKRTLFISPDIYYKNTAQAIVDSCHLETIGGMIIDKEMNDVLEEIDRLHRGNNPFPKRVIEWHDSILSNYYRLLEIWKSGNHAETRYSPKYFIEWAMSKGFSPDWLDVAKERNMINIPETQSEVCEQSATRFEQTQINNGKPVPETSLTRKWPWGTYETKRLRTLAEAVERFWVRYDPEDKTTAPTNKQVEEWLIERGESKRAAEIMASIIRPEDIPPGPRTE